MPNFINHIADFSLKAYIADKIKQADRPFWSAFFALFLSLNLIFLFHGAQYLFGDHDWQYIKNGVALNVGLFEGRFSQFVLINLLTDGEILPILNNTIGFFGYALGIALLARYWQLPHTRRAYVLFALFAGITPYILSFMYFAFLIMPVLSWSAFIIGGLILTERAPRFFSWHTLAAVTLFTLALGGYPPVINLVGVALTTRLLIYLLKSPLPATSLPPLEGLAEQKKPSGLFLPRAIAVLGKRLGCKANKVNLSTGLPEAQLGRAISAPLRSKKGVGGGETNFPACTSLPPRRGRVQGEGENTPSLTPHSPLVKNHTLNPPQPSPLPVPLAPAVQIVAGAAGTFLIAAVIYKLCLLWLTHTGAINSNYYNLQTTPFSQWGEKSLLVLTDYFKQFTATLPFITSTYKTATLIITLSALLAVISFIRQSPIVGCAPRTAGTLARLILFAAIPLAGLATLFLSTSLAETEFSPRIDFFGLNYTYAAMFALCLIFASKPIKNLAIITAVFSIIYSTHTLFEAQKVWKLGFDTEALLYKRVLKRYEQHPLFNPNGKYIMVQAGSPAFREKFYHTPYAHGSDDLLSISYTPGMNAGVMWNYQSPEEYADKTAYVYTFSPDTAAKEAIQNAKPYPAAESIAVGSYWILTVFSSPALEDLKSRYNIR